MADVTTISTLLWDNMPGNLFINLRKITFTQCMKWVLQTEIYVPYAAIYFRLNTYFLSQNNVARKLIKISSREASNGHHKLCLNRPSNAVIFSSIIFAETFST